MLFIKGCYILILLSNEQTIKGAHHYGRYNCKKARKKGFDT